MSYKHPFFETNTYHEVKGRTSDEHTMGQSLFRYCDIKVHDLIKVNDLKRINVIGKFDRQSNISKIEKGGKRFNYMRPTLNIKGETADLECYPGKDYIIQFSDVLQTYFSDKKDVEIIPHFPTEEECWYELEKSGILEIPSAENIILGYVERYDILSYEKEWQGNSYFKWKRCKKEYGDTLLVGCEHTYWGEIAGRIVAYFAEKGTSLIIYSGKLGSLNYNHVPNNSIATGNRSILPNFGVVEWENIFENVAVDNIYKGNHITMPSVLQETTQWRDSNLKLAEFVDPEIGHMALAAIQAGITFSYLHVISDNLALKFEADLSNERKLSVRKNRERLYEIIQTKISEELRRRTTIKNKMVEEKEIV